MKMDNCSTDVVVCENGIARSVTGRYMLIKSIQEEAKKRQLPFPDDLESKICTARLNPSPFLNLLITTPVLDEAMIRSSRRIYVMEPKMVEKIYRRFNGSLNAAMKEELDRKIIVLGIPSTYAIPQTPGLRSAFVRAFKPYVPEYLQDQSPSHTRAYA